MTVEMIVLETAIGETWLKKTFVQIVSENVFDKLGFELFPFDHYSAPCH